MKRRPHRPSARRLARPPQNGCRKGRSWDDYRETPAAEHMKTHVTPDVFDHFKASHWQSLPTFLRELEPHCSRLRQGALPLLILATWCDGGVVKGFLCTLPEAERLKIDR